jgi:hypothetical protein
MYPNKPLKPKNIIKNTHVDNQACMNPYRRLKDSNTFDNIVCMEYYSSTGE